MSTTPTEMRQGIPHRPSSHHSTQRSRWSRDLGQCRTPKGHLFLGRSCRRHIGAGRCTAHASRHKTAAVSSCRGEHPSRRRVSDASTGAPEAAWLLLRPSWSNKNPWNGNNRILTTVRDLYVYGIILVNFCFSFRVLDGACILFTVLAFSDYFIIIIFNIVFTFFRLYEIWIQFLLINK